MGPRQETRGHVLAVVGAAALVVSLWLPWYSFRIPQAVIDSAKQLAPQLGVLGPLVNQGAQIASQLGPLHVNSWQALATVPWLLLIAAVVGGGLSLLAVTERATNVARPIGLAGIVGLALVGYRIGVLPFSDLLHPTRGAYVALAGAGLIFLGGVVAEHDAADKAPSLTLPDFALGATDEASGSAWSTAQSTAPPST